MKCPACGKTDPKKMNRLMDEVDKALDYIEPRAKKLNQQEKTETYTDEDKFYVEVDRLSDKLDAAWVKLLTYYPEGKPSTEFEKAIMDALDNNLPKKVIGHKLTPEQKKIVQRMQRIVWRIGDIEGDSELISVDNS